MSEDLADVLSATLSLYRDIEGEAPVYIGISARSDRRVDAYKIYPRGFDGGPQGIFGKPFEDSGLQAEGGIGRGLREPPVWFDSEVSPHRRLARAQSTFSMGKFMRSRVRTVSGKTSWASFSSTLSSRSA